MKMPSGRIVYLFLLRHAQSVTLHVQDVETVVAGGGPPHFPRLVLLLFWMLLYFWQDEDVPGQSRTVGVQWRRLTRW